MHGLFVHLHHNIDKAIDFKGFQELNRRVDKVWPGALAIGPEANDDAAVFQVPGMEGFVVGKMESHCSPCVPRPYDAAATGAGGAMRDVVAMGGRPIFLLDFIGTQARYVVQMAPESVDEVLGAVRTKTDHVAVIGEITSDNKEVFEYNGESVAAIPNHPSQETLKGL